MINNKKAARSQRNERLVRGAIPIRLKRKNPHETHGVCQSHSIQVRKQASIPFTQITAASPAQATNDFHLHPATPRPIHRYCTGRLSPLPALCAAEGAITLPHQSLYFIQLGLL